MFQLIRFLCLLITLVFSSVCQSHQQKESYTTILFNQRSGNIEISQRFYIHDAEHALAIVTGKNVDLTHSETAQSDFAKYSQTKFQLKDQNGVMIYPDVVGHEVEGKYLWVYRELKIPKKIESLSIKMNALQEVWPSQINQVNLERNGKVSAARFAKDDGWKVLFLND